MSAGCGLNGSWLATRSAAGHHSPVTSPPPPPLAHPAVTGRILTAIAAGGMLGGTTRYGLGLALPTAARTFPATTFAINVSGSFVLALMLILIMEIWPPSTYTRPFAAVGFCGAYTTFSTWMVDTDRLLAAGRYGTAAAYLAGSLAAGLAATTLGLAVGRGLAVARRSSARRPATGKDAAELDVDDVYMATATAITTTTTTTTTTTATSATGQDTAE